MQGKQQQCSSGQSVILRCIHGVRRTSINSRWKIWCEWRIMSNLPGYHLSGTRATKNKAPACKGINRSSSDDQA
jgi:hypothetical protein